MVGVVIVAGGRGERMGGAVPKQFRMVDGESVLKRAVNAFRAALPRAEIVVVVPEANLGQVEEYGVKLCAGGATRTQSVRNGLRVLSAECALVAVHDGVRPFVSGELIDRCITEAQKFGSAIPVVEVVDSIRILTDKGSEPLERIRLRAVQTPQVFRASELREAYKRDGDFSDDATLMEAAGFEVHLVEGEAANRKITHPEDLIES